jgi:hypothetical protein
MVMLVGSLRVDAQRQRPLTPLPSDGLRVAPFFDGWYENPDGTIALSFGYSNLNRNEVVEIPLGPDNFIEPKEYDGRQPTSFPPVIPPRSPTERRSSNIDRRQRERGVHGHHRPASGDVVWTLRYRDRPTAFGRARVGAYRLDWPMAMGSVPPISATQVRPGVDP